MGKGKRRKKVPGGFPFLAEEEGELPFNLVKRKMVEEGTGGGEDSHRARKEKGKKGGKK